MDRLRKNRPFGKRSAPSQSIEPAKIFVISAEGKAEGAYFRAFNDYVLELGLKNRIIVDVLEKDDTNSAPMHVVSLMDEYLENLEKTIADYGIDNEELWVIIDRDKQNNSKSQLLEIIAKCKECRYNIGITNPLFEFWLLMHITDPQLYEKKVLLENKRESKSRNSKRFIDKELSRLMIGYKKENLQFQLFKPFIDNAITRAQQLEADPEKIIDYLGTSAHLLVCKILNK